MVRKGGDLVKECIHYYDENQCTPFEKQFYNDDDDYDEYDLYLCMEKGMNCSTNGSAWKEFSWNKYTETSMDYGEKTDWDIFVEEEFEI